MKKKDVLKLLIPGLENIKNSYLKAFDKLKEEKILRISFLLILAKQNLEKLRESLFLSNKEFNSIKLLFTNFKLYELTNIKQARLARYKLGKEVSLNLYYLKCFIDRKNIRKQIQNVLESWQPPVFPIDGNDLKKIGLKKGYLLGKVLKETLTWWIEKDFKPDRTKCLERSKRAIINSK